MSRPSGIKAVASKEVREALEDDKMFPELYPGLESSPMAAFVALALEHFRKHCERMTLAVRR